MENNNSMQDMLELMEESFKIPRRGNIIKGKVIQVTDNEIVVSIGYKSDGIVPRSEISSNDDVDPRDFAKEDEDLEVMVMKLDDGHGNVLLSLRRVLETKEWDILEDQITESKVIKVKAANVTKGGIVAYYHNLRGFIPASQMSLRFEKDLSKFVGQEMDVKVLDFDKGKRKLVLSRKAILAEEFASKKGEFWKDMEENKILEGEVKRIANFGAFIDIGGFDGLVHVSEISWGRINKPADALAIGDKVKVKVLSFNEDDEKISLSIKQVTPNPWEGATEKYTVGSIHSAKVLNMTDFGAFVELEPGVEGLVHVSQISKERIEKPSDALKIGESYDVKVLETNAEDKKIKLSIKAIEMDAEQAEAASEE